MIKMKQTLNQLENLNEEAHKVISLRASLMNTTGKIYIGGSNFNSGYFNTIHKEYLLEFCDKVLEDIDFKRNPLQEKLEILEKLL